MRVALLVTDLELGGTPLRVARLARDLRGLGVDVHVGCLAPPGPVSRRLDADGFPTFACNAAGASDVIAFWRLCRHLRAIRPDVLHAHLTHANVAARLVGFALGVPVLTSTATIEITQRWHLWLERLTAPLDAGHVVNAPALAEHAETHFGYAATRIHQVPPSIAPPPPHRDRDAARRQLDLPPDAFVVLWVGRMDPVKRVARIVRAVASLNDPQVCAVLVGDGPERAALTALTRELNGPVHFIGWQDDLGPAFSAADMLMLASETEGLPNVVLEALAFGLPVVAPPLPTLRELLAEDVVVPLVDIHPTAMADAIDALRRDPRAADERARAGRVWAQRYLGNAAAARLRDIYAVTIRA